MIAKYFISIDVCGACGRAASKLAIGSSKPGWCFKLYTYPRLGIYTLEDWVPYFNTENNIIEMESGGHLRKITPSTILSDIRERRNPCNDWTSSPEGYKSWNEYHTLNGTQRGPRGLLRHRTIPGECLAHGVGPWDYFVH